MSHLRKPRSSSRTDGRARRYRWLLRQSMACGGRGSVTGGGGGGRPAQEPRNPRSTAGRRPELHTHGGGCTPVGACTSSTHASHPFPSTWSGRGGDCGDAILAAPAAARHHGNCGEGGGAVCGGSWRSAPGTAPGGAGHAGSRHPPPPTPPPPPSPACARAHRHPPGLRAPPVCAHGHGCACAYKRPACTHTHHAHIHTPGPPPPPPRCRCPVAGTRPRSPGPGVLAGTRCRSDISTGWGGAVPAGEEERRGVSGPSGPRCRCRGAAGAGLPPSPGLSGSSAAMGRAGR